MKRIARAGARAQGRRTGRGGHRLSLPRAVLPGPTARLRGFSYRLRLPWDLAMICKYLLWAII